VSVAVLAHRAALRLIEDPEAMPSLDAPRRVRLGMPHLDVGGLSEGWLLRYTGDLHWEAISRRLGVATHEIREDGRQRLYPTVVALRARYDAPLATVRENDLFEASIEVEPCGRACAQGRFEAAAGRARLSLELLTTFAARQADGTMRTARPAAGLADRWAPFASLSRLALLARAARRGEPLDDSFCGPSLAASGAVLGTARHEPSPYADYNGAGLLYFAAYPTIADTVERCLVGELGLAPAGLRDWALATSPTARDVFYYGNLPLGDALLVELVSLAFDRLGVKSHVRLRHERGLRVIADVVTRRVFVGERGNS
jgi:probable biosynthetic protein (TIGR04098 family)